MGKTRAEAHLARLQTPAEPIILGTSGIFELIQMCSVPNCNHVARHKGTKHCHKHHWMSVRSNCREILYYSEPYTSALRHWNETGDRTLLDAAEKWIESVMELDGWPSTKTLLRILTEADPEL